MGGRAAGREQGRELTRMFEETALLYLRLSAFAARLHGQGALSGPRRTVLVTLARTGPQTVAQMARQRSQSRQRFQPLVNALLSEGLVRAVANPAHRQSKLIELTRQGQRAVDRFHATEERWYGRVAAEVTAPRLARATSVMRDVRVDLERLLNEGQS